MTGVNVNDSSEATYVKTFKWEFDGYYYTCRGLSENLKEKLKEVFNKWSIGFDCDRINCKSGQVNVNVTKRQFDRVELSLDPSKVATSNGVNQ